LVALQTATLNVLKYKPRVSLFARLASGARHARWGILQSRIKTWRAKQKEKNIEI